MTISSQHASSADISTCFAPGGPIARVLKTYEPRSQQTAMAQAVDRSLRARRHLLVEAGTGTGKSLAYLIPAALWAVREKKRVIISTHTRALQEQIFKKDLPLLTRALFRSGTFSYALLMGGENYLCLQRLSQARHEVREIFGDRLAEQGLARLAEWAKRGGRGLRQDLPFSVSQEVWGRVCRDADLCLGRNGPFASQCFYLRALHLARHAQVFVVNHALLFSHLFSGGTVLPPHDALILDEAHTLEEVAAHHLGFEVSSVSVKRLLDHLCNEATQRGLAYRLGKAHPRWLAELVPLVRETRAGFGVLFHYLLHGLPSDAKTPPPTPPPAPQGPTTTLRIRTEVSPPPWDKGLRALIQHLRQARPLAGGQEREQEVLAMAERCEQTLERLSTFLTQAESGWVYWIETHRTRRGARLGLRASPVDVAETLKEHLFSRGTPVILTSTTLTVGKTFEHIQRRLGLEHVDGLRLDSPFDYQKQVLIYLPPGIPHPTRPESLPAYRDAVIRHTKEILALTRGGAFILFTSFRLLQEVHVALSRDPDLADLEFLPQEAGATYGLLEQFKTSPNGVLLGAATFWQGVDVPGHALRCVVITKLPFEVPDHPVAEARREAVHTRGGDAFGDYALPEAVLRFRQGFGRLIRRRSDWGVVAFLDSRLTTHSYGRVFWDSLPPCRLTSDLREVARFLATRSHHVSL